MDSYHAIFGFIDPTQLGLVSRFVSSSQSTITDLKVPVVFSVSAEDSNYFITITFITITVHNDNVIGTKCIVKYLSN